MKAIYEFHPDFAAATVWWGDPERDWGEATFEGGDIMPAGNGVVLMGMSERTSRQAITQVAASLFRNGVAERVVVAGMPKLRAAMHLDTVFTFADRDLVTVFPRIVDQIHSFSLYRATRSPASRWSTRARAARPRPGRRPLHDLPDHPRPPARAAPTLGPISGGAIAR